jgi:branched-chain amino acid aminotransferase
MSHTSSVVPQLSWPDTNEQRHQPVDLAFANGAAFIDGRIVPIDQASIPLLDWGFLRSDACQETISTWNGKFFRLEDHLSRFERSTDRLRMTSVPVSKDEIRRVAHKLVAVCGFDNAYVQIIMTRGKPPIGSRDIRLATNRFQAFCIPYVWIASPEVQQRGMRLHISERVRVPSSSVDPMVKHYHWLDFQMGLFDAYDNETDTVVLVDLEGNITEGPGFNIFAVQNGTLITPAAGMLDGMTRRTIIELAEKNGIPVEQRQISVGEMATVHEVFLTTTAGGVLPVTSIDGRQVGNGNVGTVTATLHGAYWEARSRDWHASAVDYDDTALTL